MSDPRESEVWYKKPRVADRTLNERKYCEPCDYFYSEMFTCPICYGERKAEERIIRLLEERINAYYKTGVGSSIETAAYEKTIAFIKGDN